MLAPVFQIAQAAHGAHFGRGVQKKLEARIRKDHSAHIPALGHQGRVFAHGSLRPAQLAAELYLTRPTTSKSLARLAGAGLIERRSATDDARAAEITLTPEGIAVYERLVAAGVAMVERAIAEVHPGAGEAASIAQFARALRRYASPENQPRPQARG